MVAWNRNVTVHLRTETLEVLTSYNCGQSPKRVGCLLRTLRRLLPAYASHSAPYSSKPVTEAPPPSVEEPPIVGDQLHGKVRIRSLRKAWCLLPKTQSAKIHLESDLAHVSWCHSFTSTFFGDGVTRTQGLEASGLCKDREMCDKCMRHLNLKSKNKVVNFMEKVVRNKRRQPKRKS